MFCGFVVFVADTRMYSDLYEFLSDLDRRKLLARVAEPVSPDLEIAAVTDRACKMPGGGPALLFEHVLLDDGTRSPYPVGINLFGSMRRICLALGVERLDEIGDRIGELVQLKVPEGILGKLAMLPLL